MKSADEEDSPSASTRSGSSRPAVSAIQAEEGVANLIFPGLVHRRETTGPPLSEVDGVDSTVIGNQNSRFPNEVSASSSSKSAKTVPHESIGTTSKKGVFVSAAGASGPDYKDQVREFRLNEAASKKGAFASASSPHYKDQLRESGLKNEAASTKGAFASTSGPHYKDQSRESGLNDHSQSNSQTAGATERFSGPQFKDQIREVGATVGENISGGAVLAHEKNTTSSSEKNRFTGQGPDYKDQMRQQQQPLPPTTVQGENSSADAAPTSNNNQVPDVHAVAVSDAVLRQEFLNEYLDQIPLAEAAEETMASRRPLIGILLCLVIAAIGLTAGVCGTGNCGGSNEPPRPVFVNMTTTPAPTINAEERATNITELINSHTLSGELLSYPSLRLGEERAITWIIDEDPLQLTVTSNPWRILQRFALVSLWYYAGPWTPNSFSTNPNFWLVGEDECQWDGIVCSDESLVSALILQRKGLRGRIPSDIGLLTALTRLQLSLNDVSGPIPSAISKLTNLAIWEMYTNSLTGSLPSTLGSLTALERIDVTDNLLTGTIPDVFQAFGELNNAYFGSNNFTGSMPLCSHNSTLDVIQADCEEVQCGCCTQCL